MAREDTALANRIEEVFPTLTERLALEERMNALMAQPGFDDVAKLIAAERDHVNRSMNGQRLLEQADYAQKHGRMGGLEAFEVGAETLLARARADREAEEALSAEADAVPAGR